MMRVVTCAAAAMFAISTGWAAQLAWVNELALVHTVYVWVIDDVTDGCLPNPDVLKVEAELILRRSGIAVPELTDASARSLTISPLGYALSPNKVVCAVHLQIELSMIKLQLDGTHAYVVSFQSGIILTGPKSDMQARLRENVSVMVTDLANEILKARQQRLQPVQ